jgi:hypothetical protein
LWEFVNNRCLPCNTFSYVILSYFSTISLWLLSDLLSPLENQAPRATPITSPECGVVHGVLGVQGLLARRDLSRAKRAVARCLGFFFSVSSFPNDRSIQLLFMTLFHCWCLHIHIHSRLPSYSPNSLNCRTLRFFYDVSKLLICTVPICMCCNILMIVLLSISVCKTYLKTLSLPQ